MSVQKFTLFVVEVGEKFKMALLSSVERFWFIKGNIEFHLIDPQFDLYRS
jgi:hypothetical protein